MSKLRGIKIPRVSIDEVPCSGVHESPCVNCPSTRGTDPEVQDILKLPREKRVETAFPCAWRREKLCKGYWDKISGE